MKKKLILLITVAVAGLLSTELHAQFALKTNLLYGATTTPNLGAEYGFNTKNSVNLVYGLNPWSFSSESKGTRQVKHWVVMPEYRRWHCSVFNGSFIGIHAMGGQFNAGNVDLWLPGGFFDGDNLIKGANDKRYEGNFVGLGFTYGYQFVLSRHWNIEMEIGAGYNYVWYDRFRCGECGAKEGNGHTNYVGITKVGLSILYIF